MPSRSSTIVAVRYPRPEPPRRRRWPWLIILALLLALAYFTLRQRQAPTPTTPPSAQPRIGIIAGHWQFDSGAICPDGLREVDITTAVARQVADQLRAQGYVVDLLGEYSDRLDGYRAAALVSLHVDSCMYDLSGYKLAASSQAAAATDSALLLQEISRAYGAATGMGFHADTITPDMTDYHAFQRIDARTPAVIIELGFMSGDRNLLITHPEQAADGVVEGVVSFLKTKAPSAPSPTPPRR